MRLSERWKSGVKVKTAHRAAEIHLVWWWRIWVTLSNGTRISINYPSTTTTSTNSLITQQSVTVRINTVVVA